MSNHTHGGPRSGAGRPRKTEKRINKSVTLLPRQIEALAALPGQTYQALDLGLNIAIPAIQQAGGDEGRLCAQIAYQGVNEAIRRLEAPWMTAVEEELLTILHGFKTELIKHYLFTERTQP